MDHDRIIRYFIAMDRRGDISPHETLRTLLDFWYWLQAGFCRIRYEDTTIGPLTPNLAQQIIFSRMLTQAAAGQPIRLVILKARKLGASTFIESFIVFCCAHYADQIALMAAHQHPSTLEIFEIAGLMAEEYGGGATVINQKISYPNRSVFRCRTAGGKGVAAGGTPNIVHKSEVALWDRGTQDESDYTINNAVPNQPGTVIIDESTARGRDLFYRRFEQATDGVGAYLPVFLPWFLHASYRVNTLAFELDEEELAIQRVAVTYGLTVGYDRLAWRRQKILEVGPHVFRQEFPSTPDEAVQSASNLVLPGMRECVIDELPFNASAIYDPTICVGGIDYGHNDPTVIITGYHYDQVLYVTQIMRASQSLASELADGLCDFHHYFDDPSGPQQRAELLQAGRSQGKSSIGITAAPRRKTKLRTIVNDEWNGVATMMRQGKLKILRGCEAQLVLEADNLSWNSATEQPDQFRSEETGHFDTLDALRYLVAGVSRTRVLTAPAEKPKDQRRPPSRREAMRRY